MAMMDPALTDNQRHMRRRQPQLRNGRQRPLRYGLQRLRNGPLRPLKNGPQPPSGRQLQPGSPRPPLRLRVETRNNLENIDIFFKTWKEKIKCVWTSWGSWSHGIKTCDETTMVRRRECECRGGYGSEAESYEKKECDGKKIQARVKKLPSCYVAPPPPQPASYKKPKSYGRYKTKHKLSYLKII